MTQSTSTYLPIRSPHFWDLKGLRHVKSSETEAAGGKERKRPLWYRDLSSSCAAYAHICVTGRKQNRISKTPPLGTQAPDTRKTCKNCLSLAEEVTTLKTENMEWNQKVLKLAKLTDEHVDPLHPVLNHVKEVLSCGSTTQLDLQEKQQTDFKASAAYLLYLRIEVERAKSLTWDEIASAMPELNLTGVKMKTRYYEATRTMRILGIPTGDAPEPPKLPRVSVPCLDMHRLC